MIIKRITPIILLAVSLYACTKNTMDNENKTDNFSVEEPLDYELKIQRIHSFTNSLIDISSNTAAAYQNYISAFGNEVDTFKPNDTYKFVDFENETNLRMLDDLTMPVLNDLSSLITRYKINARAFSVAINSCQRYYSSQGYKKDNFENGKGMHKPMIEIFAKFSAADNILKSKSNKILENLKFEQLNQLKKEGQMVAYLSMIGKNDAEKLNTMLTSTKYESLDVKKLLLFYDKIKGTYNELKIIKDSDANQFTSKGTIYFNKFEQFYLAFEELYVHKKEKKKFSKKEMKKLKENMTAASLITGSPNKVVAKYEAMAEAYDSNLALK